MSTSTREPSLTNHHRSADAGSNEGPSTPSPWILQMKREVGVLPYEAQHQRLNPSRPLLLGSSAGHNSSANADTAGPVQMAQAASTISGNPEERKDRRGRNTTAHQTIEPSQAHNMPEAEMVFAPEDVGSRSVRVKAGPSNPIKVPAGGKAPGQSDVYEVLQGANASTGTAVKGITGTVQAPEVQARGVPNKIFIGPGEGTPSAEDVQQGEIGDCYFLAALNNILSSDPGKIKQTIRANGTGTTAVFYYLDGGSGTWRTTQIQQDLSLVHRKTRAGTASGLIGAALRINPVPATSEYFGTIDGDKLTIRRVDYYEMASWAPMIEKSYARFAQVHGKHGKEGAQQGSGYDILHSGGLANDILGIFYGDRFAGAQSTLTATNYKGKDSASDLVVNNQAVIRQLLSLTASRTDSSKPRENMVAYSLKRLMLPRLKDQLGFILGQKPGPGEARLHRILKTLETTIRRWEAARQGSGAQTTLLENISRSAAGLAKPGAYPPLSGDKASPAYRALLELLVDLATDQNDAKAKQRMIYTEHAYSVLDATFANKEAQKLNLTAATLPRLISQIDPNTSTVLVRNPHRKNEPDARGVGTPAAENDGQFTMTLVEFIRNFNVVARGVVKR